jgi:sugar transferase (PEP-CTERM system associated)
MFKAFSQYFPLRVVFLPVTENLLLWGSLLLAVYIRYYRDPFSAEELVYAPSFGAEALVIILLCQFCFYCNDLYNPTVAGRSSERWIRRAQALGGWCVLLFLGYLVYPGLLVQGGILTTTVLLALVALTVWREAVNWMGIVFEKRQRVLFLGTGSTGIDLCRTMLARKDLNFKIVGFLDEDPARVGEAIVNPSIIGTIDELVEVVERERVERIVVSLPDRRGRLPVRDLLKLRLQGVHVEDAHTLYEHVAGRISLDSVHPSWMIFSDGFRKLRWQLFLKRCFDVVAASVGLVLSLPIMVLVAILVKLDSKGPVLFRQERVGQFGKVFELFKFRSMTAEAEAEGRPQWATPNDSRITRIGRFLRQSRLDELPQFFNILRGNMSFVGPRPERPYFVDRLEKSLKYYQDRHVVKPGLTGWAQINFRYASSEEETREKLEYDFFYIKNFSVLFDLVIIFRTMKIVLWGEGAR